MTEQMNALKEQITAAKAEYKTLTTSLNALQSTVTTADLRECVHELELARKELLGRLTPLRSGHVHPVPLAERDRLDHESVIARRDARSRKRIFDDFWALLGDHLPDGMSPSDVWVRPPDGTTTR